MEVLAVAIPFKALVEHRAGRTLRLGLADPESAGSRPACAFTLVEAAYPACTDVVRPELAELAVHLLRKCHRGVEVQLT